MKNKKMEFTFRNVVFYLSGFFFIGFAVNILLRAELGAGAWDTVTSNLRAFLSYSNIDITLGVTSMLITLTLFTFVLLYTRKWQLVFMLLPIFLMGTVLDFWDIVIFKDYYATLIIIRILFSIFGAVLIPLGLALIISSKFPAFVFDELTIVVMDIFKTKSITKARLGIEFTGISLGIMFGFLAHIGFGAVSVGSIVMAIILPPIFNFFVKKLGAFDE